MLLRRREDKEEANDETTYVNTVANLREDVKLHELYSRTYTEEDVREVCNMLRSHVSSDGGSGVFLELEFRFDKVSKATYEDIHSRLKTCDRWKAVERSHTRDQIRGGVRRTVSLHDVRDARIFIKKRIASHALTERKDLKCVLSSEEQVESCKIDWNKKSSDVLREKRRVSFVLEEEHAGVTWAFDLTCVNPGGANNCRQQGTPTTYEVEVECRRFEAGDELARRYVAESGLMKCQDVLRML